MFFNVPLVIQILTLIIFLVAMVLLHQGGTDGGVSVDPDGFNFIDLPIPDDDASREDTPYYNHIYQSSTFHNLDDSNIHPPQ
jgi:hypothetical protein